MLSLYDKLKSVSRTLTTRQSTKGDIMTLTECKDLANELFKVHELDEWNFGFDRSLRRFGQTRYADKTITMSAALVELNSADRVKNTILHEVAHALTPRYAQAHGVVWRNIARSIGCDATAHYSVSNTVVPLLQWQATCDCAGVVFSKTRKPRASYACRTCNKELTYKRVQ